MMEIHLSGSPGEIRASLLNDDTLVETALWRPGAPDGWGDIHVVRVVAQAPALDGAFVQLVQGGEGFLTTRKKVTEGSLLCAQIVRAAQNGKGVRLKPVPPPHDTPYEISQLQAPTLIQAGPTPIEELASRAPEAPLLVEDMAVAASLPHALRQHVQRIPQNGDTLLEGEWDELSQPSISLGPLIAHITPTPSLTAIDLDAHARPDFGTNVACFPTLLRQIRLRNLSGTLLIDPAGVRSRKRPALVPFLRDAAEAEQDPMQPKVTGITPSGLLELTRPRRRPPLHELLNSPHGKALTILRTILKEGRSGHTLHAPPSIIHALEQDPVALKEFTLAHGQMLQLQVEPPSSSALWSLS